MTHYPPPHFPQLLGRISEVPDAHSPPHPEVHASRGAGAAVVAWVVSLWAYIGVDLSNDMELGVQRGSAVWYDLSRWQDRTDADVFVDWGPRNEPPLGHFDFERSLNLTVPIAWPITALLPFAIGPFISYRFRLWHYLAYTALVAVELAYYLRWQQ
jgi:hypothetical protein